MDDHRSLEAILYGIFIPLELLVIVLVFGEDFRLQHLALLDLFSLLVLFSLLIFFLVSFALIDLV